VSKQTRPAASLATGAGVSPRIDASGRSVFSVGKTEVGHYHQCDFVVVGDGNVEMWTSLDGGELSHMDTVSETRAVRLFKATKAAGFKAVW
jgi:hypothetical protein